MTDLRFDSGVQQIALLIFTGWSKGTEFGLTLALEALQSRSKAIYLKSGKKHVGSDNDRLISSPNLIKLIK